MKFCFCCSLQSGVTTIAIIGMMEPMLFPIYVNFTECGSSYYWLLVITGIVIVLVHWMLLLGLCIWFDGCAVGFILITVSYHVIFLILLFVLPRSWCGVPYIAIGLAVMSFFLWLYFGVIVYVYEKERPKDNL